MTIMARKRRMFLSYMSIGLCIALCGAVLAVGLVLSAPAPAVIGDAPPELPGAVTISFPSASGSTIHGWWVPRRMPGTGAVILIHGIRANRLQMIRRAEFLQGQGFATLLIDLQAHGESPGRRITFGKLEALDAEAALRVTRAQVPGERVGLIGVSLGGAAAVLAPKPLNLDALVLESVYPDIDAALSNRLCARLGPIIGPIATPFLAPLFTMLLPPIFGVTPFELRPIDRVGSLRMPILIASGTQDEDTPLAEAQDIFDHVRSVKRFWPVQGAGHVDLERFDPAAYWDVVLPFLTEHLRPEESRLR